MTGMVFGSAGVPLSPWHAAQSCAFASISSAACTGGMAAARPIPIPKITERKRVYMGCLSTWGPKCGRIPYLSRPSSNQESPMRAKLILTLAATAAAMVFPPAIDAVRAEGPAALTGLVSSEAEGKMEGVVVTARRAKSIVQVSVTTDAEGRYSFPRDRLEPGEYTLSIRAVGYDIDSPAKATVANGKAATADMKLKTTRNLAGQLTNAEWMMSIPGTEEQKAGLLNCVGCHTLERVVRSTHDSDEWTRVISRMLGYGAVSQPIKPQTMLDRNRAGTPEQYRKLAEYLATINLSAVDHWPYELKTLPRPKGRDTRAIVTQYDVVRPTSEPHDVLVDREGKVWFDTMYQGSLGCLDPKTGKIDYYPLPPEYNDDTVQLNFTGLRHDVDGKVWTKSVGTQHIFRFDLATNKWERFHPTDYLPEGAPKNAGIYQVISDSQNNLWMAEFTQGHLGKIDAKTTKVTWWPFPTPNARGRRMNIDDQDRIVVTEYRGNKVAVFDTRAEKFTEYELPARTYPYRANFDRNGELWVSTMHTDRVVRLDPKTGTAVQYLMPSDTNMRTVFVDKSTTPTTFWVGSNHDHRIVKVEPLD